MQWFGLVFNIMTPGSAIILSVHSLLRFSVDQRSIPSDGWSQGYLGVAAVAGGHTSIKKQTVGDLDLVCRCVYYYYVFCR